LVAFVRLDLGVYGPSPYRDKKVVGVFVLRFRAPCPDAPPCETNQPSFKAVKWQMAKYLFPEPGYILGWSFKTHFSNIYAELIRKQR
jgi:hypothetical protein